MATPVLIGPGIFWDPREPCPQPFITPWSVANKGHPTTSTPIQPDLEHHDHSETDQPQSNGEGFLTSASSNVRAQLIHDTAKVVVTQSFMNATTNVIRNASYTFPLPTRCTIVEFICHIGREKTLKGKVKAREDAQEEFRRAIGQDRIAGTLDQETPEIFTTTLGNLPPNTLIRAELTFIMLLKYQFAGERGETTLTLPNYIAPRYGSPPSTLQRASMSTPKKLSIQVNVLAAERIAEVNCDSHNVSVQLGIGDQQCQSWTEFAESQNADTEKMALVKLSAGTTHLQKDFVLRIVTIPEASLEQPFACVESDPSSTYQALMLTIPSAFMLQNQTSVASRDIIFLADLSGSMSDKIDSLKSAMKYFLNGLPMECHFNIWCFGNSYEHLWPKSQVYSNENLAQALLYVQTTFAANMGGTRLLPVLHKILQSESWQTTTDVVVLTDGQIWDLDETLDFVQKKRISSENLLRLFALGIGDAVSHELVEGLAKSGGGYAEVVPSIAQQDLSHRTVAVLKAVLTGHIGPLQIEIDGRKIHEPQLRHWPWNWGQDQDIFGDFRQRSTMPENAYCSPRNVALMSPFLRNRFFVLLTDSTTPPNVLTLNVARPGTNKMSITVPIKSLTRPDSILQKLGARSVLGDLERSESHLRERSKIDKLRKEGVRLGCLWSLVSKWTSFVLSEEPYQEDQDNMHIENLLHEEARGDHDLLRARGTYENLTDSPLDENMEDATNETEDESSSTASDERSSDISDDGGGQDNDKDDNNGGPSVQGPPGGGAPDSSNKYNGSHRPNDNSGGFQAGASSQQTSFQDRQCLGPRSGFAEFDSELRKPMESGPLGADTARRRSYQLSTDKQTYLDDQPTTELSSISWRGKKHLRPPPPPPPAMQFSSLPTLAADLTESSDAYIYAQALPEPLPASFESKEEFSREDFGSASNQTLNYSHTKKRTREIAPRNNLPASTALLEFTALPRYSANEQAKRDILDLLVGIQCFDGSFSPPPATFLPSLKESVQDSAENVRSLFGDVFMEHVAEIKVSIPHMSPNPDTNIESVAIVVGVIAILECHFQLHKDLWQRIYDKAKSYVDARMPRAQNQLHRLATMVFRDFKLPYLRKTSHGIDPSNSRVDAQQSAMSPTYTTEDNAPGMFPVSIPWSFSALPENESSVPLEQSLDSSNKPSILTHDDTKNASVQDTKPPPSGTESNFAVEKQQPRGGVILDFAPTEDIG